MTNDEIQALIDAQEVLKTAAEEDLATAQTGVTSAVAAVATAQAAVVTAQAAVVTAQALVTSAQASIAAIDAEIARLRSLLEADGFDVTHVTHGNILDGWGLRRGKSETVQQWEDRTGLKARVVQTFANARPWNAGEWGNIPAQVLNGSARWLAQTTPPVSSTVPMVRGKKVTPSQLSAQLSALRSVANGQKRAQHRRGFSSLLALEQRYPGLIEKTNVRYANEQLSPWFWYGFFLSRTDFITQAQADKFNEDFADAMRGSTEQLMWDGYEVLGPELYPKLTFVINQSGLLFKASALRLVRRSWPVNMPPGTRIVLSSDDYIQDPGDIARLRDHLANIRILLAELPNVVGFAFDEIGPHCYMDITAAELASLGDEMEDFVDTLLDFQEEMIAEDLWAWGCWYETERPNNRDTSTTMIVDREIVMPGTANSTFTGRNGERVPSNYARMATRFIQQIHARAA